MLAQLGFVIEVQSVLAEKGDESDVEVTQNLLLL